MALQVAIEVQGLQVPDEPLLAAFEVELVLLDGLAQSGQALHEALGLLGRGHGVAPIQVLDVGRFRQRFLPLILAHLQAAAPLVDVEQRARLTIRALQFQPKAPRLDFSAWREIASSLLQALPPEHELAKELRSLIV